MMIKTKKLTFISIIFVLFTAMECDPGKPTPPPMGVVADPNQCNIANASDKKEYEKFLCIGSDKPRDYYKDNDPFADNFCPDEKKYGHTFLLVDTTQKLTTNQMEAVYKRFLSPVKLNDFAPYDKLSIMNIAGFDEDKNKPADVIFNEPYFSNCKPRSGKSGTMYRQLNEYVAEDDTLVRMEIRDGEFTKELEEARKKVIEFGARESDFSQIMEQLYELSKRSDFQPDWEYRRILMFSDLLQHSDNVSIWNSCTKSMNKKCKSFERVKNSMTEEKWNAFVPDFGPNPPTVHIMYMNCFADKELKTGALKLWQEFFADLNIPMTFELESSIGCQVVETVGT